MRDIKFRALIQHGGEKPSWEQYPTLSMPWWSDEHLLNVKIIVKDIQFTGLKDKNGIEIYEGDVLDFENGYKSEITFNNGCFSLDDGQYRKDLTHGVIIGNIYEHPQLLESKP